MIVLTDYATSRTTAPGIRPFTCPSILSPNFNTYGEFPPNWLVLFAQWETRRVPEWSGGEGILRLLSSRSMVRIHSGSLSKGYSTCNPYTTLQTFTIKCCFSTIYYKRLYCCLPTFTNHDIFLIE